MNFLPKNIKPENLLDCLRKISFDIFEICRIYNKFSLNNDEFGKILQIKDTPSGPVTDVDIKINKIILDTLNKYFASQEWEILSEESKQKKLVSSFQDDWVWIIDPLDGTKDFIQNTGEYAVHIALTFKKQVILSNVLIPQRHESWFYLRGYGTWCEAKNDKKVDIKSLNYKYLEEMVIVTSRNHCPQELKSIIKHLNPLKVIQMGSIGYKIISILRGEADLYISYSEKNKSCPKDWDMAAPDSIMRGCNGFFTNEKGENLEYLTNNQFRQEGLVIASINKRHLEICNKIKQTIS